MNLAPSDPWSLAHLAFHDRRDVVYAAAAIPRCPYVASSAARRPPAGLWNREIAEEYRSGTFALAVGVLIFSVTAALVIGDQRTVSVVVPVAEVAAVLAAIALIRSLRMKAFTSIQQAPALAAIAQQGRGIIDDLYRQQYTAEGQPAPSLPPRRGTVSGPDHQTTLEQPALSRLLRAAGSAVIVPRAGIGDTLQQGSPVTDVHDGEVTDASVLAGLVTGQERTFARDPLLASRPSVRSPLADDAPASMNRFPRENWPRRAGRRYPSARPGAAVRWPPAASHRVRKGPAAAGQGRRFGAGSCLRRKSVQGQAAGPA